MLTSIHRNSNQIKGDILSERVVADQVVATSDRISQGKERTTRTRSNNSEKGRKEEEEEGEGMESGW
jgi:hypothetical protein